MRRAHVYSECGGHADRALLLTLLLNEPFISHGRDFLTPRQCGKLINLFTFNYSRTPHAHNPRNDPLLFFLAPTSYTLSLLPPSFFLLLLDLLIDFSEEGKKWRVSIAVFFFSHIDTFWERAKLLERTIAECHAAGVITFGALGESLKRPTYQLAMRRDFHPSLLYIYTPQGFHRRISLCILVARMLFNSSTIIFERAAVISYFSADGNGSMTELHW